MAEGPIGEFYRSYPDFCALHRNEPGQPLVIVPCHEHTWGHMRALWASDTPGPDGRVGWWEKAWSPIKDLNAMVRNAAKMAEDQKLKAAYESLHPEEINSDEMLLSMGLEKETIGWHEERNHHVRANGPDSSRWIPEGWRHEFTLLSATGYHECYKFHRDTEGNKSPVFHGHMPGYA